MHILRICCGFLAIACCVTSQTVVNIIHINQRHHSIADRAIDAVEGYFRVNWSKDILLNIQRVEANPTNLLSVRDDVCQLHTSLIGNGSAVHGILNTATSAPLSLYAWLLAMHSQLPTATVTYANVSADHEQITAEIIASKASTRCACFPERLASNRNMREAIAPVSIIPHVVRLMVAQMGMNSAAILYDSGFEIVGENALFMASTKVRHVIQRVHSGIELIEQIDGLRRVNIYNFFVLGSLQTFEWILRTLPTHFLSHNYLWIFITHEMGKPLFCPRLGRYLLIAPLKNHEAEHAEMSDIMMQTYFQWTVEHVLSISESLKNGPSVATTCKSSQQATSTYAIEPIETMFKYDNETVQQAYLDFTMDISVTRCNDNDRIRDTNVLANWNAWFTEPLNVFRNDELQGLRSVVLYHVSTALKTPFVMLDPSTPTGFAGYCIDLLDMLATTIGFQYNISLVPDGQFGNLNEDGSWNGVVREIINKRADIGLGAMSVMAERENVIDFTVPYYDLVGIAIMMKIPHVSADYFRFLSVMEAEVWLCILVSYVVTSVVLWLTDRLSPFSYQNSREWLQDAKQRQNVRIFDLKESLWFCLMSLTPQGGGQIPRSMSSQCVVATWWMYGFIILASYTANLAAFLTVNRLGTEIEDLDDLAKQFQIEYAPIPNTMEWTYFERMANIEGRFYRKWTEMTMNDSLSVAERRKLVVWEYPLGHKYTKIWQHIQRTEAPRSLGEAIERVRNSTATSGFAYLGDAANIQYLALKHCELRMVGEEFSRKPYAVAVQQGSPLKEAFDKEILRLLSSRWLEKLKAKWWPRPQFETGRCANQPGHFDGIGFDNIAGFFLMMLAGIALASVSLVGEWLFFRQRRQQIAVEPIVTIPGETVETVRGQIWNFGSVVGSIVHKDIGGGGRENSIGWAENLTMGADGGRDVAQALDDIVKCRQRRRRLSRSVCAEDPDEICWMSSCEA